jgi:hypothetical protein
MSFRVGDTVVFKPKYYGESVPDQWSGLTGIILEIIEASGSAHGATVLVTHPDEPSPIPIFAFFSDFKKAV